MHVLIACIFAMPLQTRDVVVYALHVPLHIPFLSQFVHQQACEYLGLKATELETENINRQLDSFSFGITLTTLIKQRNIT